MLQFLLMCLAWFLLMLGFVFLFSPIPMGIVFIALGLSLLVYASEAITERVVNFRRQHHKLNAQLIWLEAKLNNRVRFVGSAMSKTRPFGPDEMGL